MQTALARQRDEHASIQRLGPQLPRQHCRDALGIEPATRREGDGAPVYLCESWNKTTCCAKSALCCANAALGHRAPSLALVGTVGTALEVS
jgi:hypothetical protein